MKKKNELEMMEKKFCKLTDGLAHKDCPDNCAKKITKEIPKNRIRILERYESQINLKKEQRDNLYFFWVMDEGFKSKDGKYEIEKALDKCKFISRKFSVLPNPKDLGNRFAEDPYTEEEYEKKRKVSEKHNIMELRDCLRQMRKRKEEGRFFGLIKPKPISEIEAYFPSKEFFGSNITYEHITSEIENQIAMDKGQNNEVLEKLRKNYRLNKKDIEEILRNRTKKDKKFIKQTRELDRLLSEDQPLKRKRMKEIKKPFQFNMSQVLVARKMKIISPEESQVLKFRYNLEDQGTKSLRWIACLIGKSHTTVRNMENSAPKKMKEHMSKIKKSIPIRESLGWKATTEEYKRMYGYYPDLGKK